MANGKPTPGAVARKGRREGFDADKRTQERQNTPVTIAGVDFKRRRKDWGVTRAMRQTMRAQEKNVALSNRLRVRVAELEAEQIEAASKGEEAQEAELEQTIEELIVKADEATEDAELVTYKLLALLLVPPDDIETDIAAAPGEDPPSWPKYRGWGPDEADDVGEAIKFLQPALDVEDAAELCQELTGSREPDPQTTPSSESGSS